MGAMLTTAMPTTATETMPNRQQSSEHDDVAIAVERLTVEDPRTLSALDRLPPQVRQHLASHLLGEPHDGPHNASLLAAAEQWNVEDPYALPTLELLPEEVLQYIASHILGEDGKSTSEAENSDTEQVTHDEESGLPTLEGLPTEMIQNVATYLFRNIHGHPAYSRYDGFLEFRSVSQTIRAKTEYTFVRSFEAHDVGFSERGLLGLLELSEREEMRSHVRSLVFFAPKHCKTESHENNLIYWQRVGKAIQMPEVNALLLHDSLNTAMLAVALSRFTLESIYVVPNLNTLYPEELRELNASIGGHPPTIIFNAVLLSNTNLQHFHFGAKGWATCHGIRPAAMRLGNPVLGLGMHMEKLTTLTLHLVGESGMVFAYLPMHGHQRY